MQLFGEGSNQLLKMISQLSFTASLDPKMQYIGMDYTHCNSYWGPLRRAKE